MRPSKPWLKSEGDAWGDVAIFCRHHSEMRGLADIAAGRTFEADTALAQLQQRRKTSIKLPTQQRG